MESGSSTEATTSIPVTKVKGKRKRNLNLEKPHSCIWPGCTKCEIYIQLLIILVCFYSLTFLTFFTSFLNQ